MGDCGDDELLDAAVGELEMSGNSGARRCGCAVGAVPQEMWRDGTGLGICGKGVPCRHAWAGSSAGGVGVEGRGVGAGE